MGHFHDLDQGLKGWDAGVDSIAYRPSPRPGIALTDFSNCPEITRLPTSPRPANPLTEFCIYPKIAQAPTS